MKRTCDKCIHAVIMSGRTEHKGNTTINYGTNAMKCELPKIESMVISNGEIYCNKYEEGTPQDNSVNFKDLKIGVKKYEK